MMHRELDRPRAPNGETRNAPGFFHEEMRPPLKLMPEQRAAAGP